MNFFATTIKGSNADNSLISDCNFLYPNCYAHALNQINYGESINTSISETYTNQMYFTGTQNMVIRNNVFKYTDGSVIELLGGNNILTNNYLSYIDKTVCNLSSVMTCIRLGGSNNTVSYNTIHKTAADQQLIQEMSQ